MTIEGDDGAGSGIVTYEVKLDGVTEPDRDVTVTGNGVHTIESRIVDNVGHASDWRTDTVRIDTVAPTASLACAASTGWNARAVSCTPTASGGPSGLSSLRIVRNGVSSAAVSGHAVSLTTDGTHSLALYAIDGAGNTRPAVTATVKIDRTVPAASLSCAATSAPTGYTCKAAGSDRTSGLASVAYSLNGGAWTPVANGGSFAVAKGTVRVRALDVAGNQALTGPATLTERKAPVVVTDPVTVRSSTKPVYLAGSKDADSLVGALLAARSPNGTVSIDLRPLAVGRGKFKVEIKLMSGKHHRTVRKTYKVGRDGTLPRIAASLSKATAKTTVQLTVRKKSGRSWKRYATSKVVLAK